MTTITLICAFCGEKFEKDLQEYKRRLSKLPDNPNFFCNLSCNAKYRNAQRNSQPPPPQHGNHYGQKYPEEVNWYVTRCAKDRRFGLMEQEYRIPFAEGILELWKQQEGKCAITGVPLRLRIGAKGRCETDDPFKIASLDRIDNDQVYTVENVQWVSLAVNLARQALSLEQFTKYYREFLVNTNTA